MRNTLRVAFGVLAMLVDPGRDDGHCPGVRPQARNLRVREPRCARHLQGREGLPNPCVAACFGATHCQIPYPRGLASGRAMTFAGALERAGVCGADAGVRRIRIGTSRVASAAPGRLESCACPRATSAAADARPEQSAGDDVGGKWRPGTAR